MRNIQIHERLKRVKDDPSRVVILGAGDDGVAMMETLQDAALMRIVAVVDSDKESPGIYLAKQMGIKTFTDVEEALLASAPCVVFNLTGNEMVEEVAANTLGVGAVIGGTAARFMWHMVTDLKKAKEVMEFQATHDVLTNLVNRRYMIEHLHQEVERCKRYKMTCAVVMIDLDHFKGVNDTHGHCAGDKVLTAVTSRVAGNLRGSDVVARWGGEEFLALLPHTEKKIAAMVAGKWLLDVKNNPVQCGDRLTVPVSFSAGVASIDELDKGLSTEEAVDALLAMVDKRLYAAKDKGRSQVVIDN